MDSASLTKEHIDAFCCVICMDLYHAPILVAPCGHSFCQTCMESWLPQHANCPVCKAGVNRPSLIRNYGLERVACVATQFGAARLDILFTLLGSRVEMMTPLLKEMEEAVRDKTMTYLTSWQAYLQDVSSTFEAEIRKIEDEYRTLIKTKASGFTDQGLQSASTDLQLSRLRAEKQGKIFKVQTDQKATLQKILHAFKAQLSLTSLLSPGTLDIPVTVVVEQPATQFEFQVKPHHTIVDVKEAITSHFEAQHMPLVFEVLAVEGCSSQDPPPVVAVSAGDPMEMDGSQSSTMTPGEKNGWNKIAFVVVRKLGSRSEETVVHVNDLTPISSLLRPGDVLKVRGALPTKAQTEVQCFTATFRKFGVLPDGRPCSVSSFYVCETCKLSWICECCVEHCHREHLVKLQIKNKECARGQCFCCRKICQAVHKHEGSSQLCYPGSNSSCPTCPKDVTSTQQK